MAQQPTIGFKSIQLLKTQTLGIGSYGIVCKALCDDLLCAAKVIHQTLFDPNLYQQVERNKQHRLPIQRFMQECEFMSAIRHPNIVQFLGTHQDPQTGLPVLLMELMDDSLTHFLESSQDAVPYHIQVNFYHDITLAISYLHSNGITHRDLSSNNVLLRGNLQAKVTDFGMAKLINPRATRVSFTLSPGTDVYMPPEAVQDIPEYTEKIDCFAIGTLIIQILTRRFPDPGGRQKGKQIYHPDIPGGTVYVPVLEIERRHNHISLVDPNHPLLPIALECLKDNGVERPSAQELCQRAAALKETPQFRESVRRAQERPADNTTEREEEIGELRQQVQDKDDIIEQKVEEYRQMRHEHAQQIRRLQQIIGSQNNRLRENEAYIEVKNYNLKQKDDIIREKDQVIEDKERRLQDVTDELESNQQVMAQFQTRIQELEQELKKKSQREVPVAKPSLRWREGKKAPREMKRGPDAVVNGESVYLKPDSYDVLQYNSNDETWSWLPECKNNECSLVIVNNLLTTIGGRDIQYKVITNKLYSLTEDKTWREVFPPMPTKRASSIVMCTGQALIVAGGIDEKMLQTVEIMDIKTQQWSSAADLPEPLIEASATICHDQIYIVGGWKKGGHINSVYTCTLTDLFQSCRSKTITKRLAQSLSLTSPSRSTVWSKVADLPVRGSTCVTLHSQLLAIGGYDSDKATPTTDVRIYNPSSNTWEVISKMNTKHYRCFAAVLPTNELMVVGGYIRSIHKTDSVEIATATII